MVAYTIDGISHVADVLPAGGIPVAVTGRQAKLALLAAGKLDQVEVLLQAAPRAVQIAWETAGTFERTNPLIAGLASQVGLTSTDIDQLFVEAAKL